MSSFMEMIGTSLLCSEMLNAKNIYQVLYPFLHEAQESFLNINT